VSLGLAPLVFQPMAARLLCRTLLCLYLLTLAAAQQT
jgi:hypothetical protein